MKLRAGLFLFLLSLLVFGINIAHADLLPPQAAPLQQRFAENPQAYDRVDPWCKSLTVNEACTIPGNTLQGGGSGQCKRSMDRSYRYIDLTCSLNVRPVIERGLPSGPWQAWAGYCGPPGSPPRDAAQLSQMQTMGWSCEEPALATDRFCTGLTEDQACTLSVTAGATVSNFDGVCQRKTESKSIYHQGRKSLTRPVLQCQSPLPLTASPLEPVNAWRKLVQ
ncbi:hypothetical protein [Ottowia thiooxydans]|uniref:hypothetical protein n=1 Tax=Ottowia thiooxydans TaxID=219182 RepID=UPI0004251617|nr:hypothetical protein [Ottowia thiooxydans]